MQSTKNEMMWAGIKLLLGAVFAAIGCWVVSLAIGMVGSFGENMGVDAQSRLIYSRAHIAVHLFGTVSSVAVRFFQTQRHKILASFAIAAIVFCGGYGIINMIGFTTTNRLAVAEQKTASIDADWKAYEAKRAAIQADIDWARKTEVTEESPRERRRLLSRIDGKLMELAAVEPPKPRAATVLADPQATWFARLTDSGTDKWQLALPVPVAFLLFGTEVLCFVFAMHLIIDAFNSWRGSRIADSNNHASPGSYSSSGNTAGGDGKHRKFVTDTPKNVTAKASASLTANGMAVSKEASAASAVAKLAGGGISVSKSPPPPTPSPTSGVQGAHISEDTAKNLRAAADLFVSGGSPLRSIRALARHFGVHHTTAGDYVLRAKWRKASEERTH